jgi:hypothetical protein
MKLPRSSSFVSFLTTVMRVELPLPKNLFNFRRFYQIHKKEATGGPLSKKYSHKIAAFFALPNKYIACSHSNFTKVLS